MKYTHSIFAKLRSSKINRKQWAKHYKTEKLKEKWESRWYSFVIQKKALIKNTTCRNEVVFVQILPNSTVDLLTIMPHEKKLPMPYTQHHKALQKARKENRNTVVDNLYALQNVHMTVEGKMLHVWVYKKA